MKFLFDIFPVFLFFIAFKWADGNPEQAASWATYYLHGLVSGGEVSSKDAPLLLATLVVIVATLGQVIWLKIRGKHVDLMLWISLGLVTIMGGATIWSQNELFIKWKPSILYWFMGMALWVSQKFFNKNILKSIMGTHLNIPDRIWYRLGLMWAAFFCGMGFLNIGVAYNFSTDIWIKFKLFGTIGLMVAFTILQTIYIGKYINSESEKN